MSRVARHCDVAGPKVVRGAACTPQLSASVDLHGASWFGRSRARCFCVFPTGSMFSPFPPLYWQVPSAPPLHVDLETVLEGEGDLLSLEPPTWVPDSHAGDCSACHEAFRCGAVSRSIGRHELSLPVRVGLLLSSTLADQLVVTNIRAVFGTFAPQARHCLCWWKQQVDGWTPRLRESVTCQT